MPFHIEPKGDEFEVVDDKGKSYGVHKTRQQAIDQQRALYAAVPEASKKETDAETEKAAAEINALPDSAFLHVESGGTKDDGGKTVPRTLRHLPYKTADGGIDLPKLRNALSRLGQPATGNVGGEKWLSESLRESLQKHAQKILADNTDAESAKKEADDQPSALDRLVNFFTGKEGRRNSSPDAQRLQQIHDLSVQNGADCALMVKEVNGKSRWVLLSTNAYQDRDGEIVSRKAQNKDTERMNADQNFGPLRLWHLGYPDVEKKEAGPGVDIGDCDYSQMFGRVRIESGTFRNNRIAAAIKGRADQWATSVGFFHPVEEPDQEGVYHNIHTFERSLLPRSKAANALTPLAAIVKENSMTTKEEKISQLTKLLGSDELAAEVLKQADATEKQAQERGLKYKEQQPPAAPKVSEKNDKKDGGEPDEDDMDGMDEATAKAYKAMLPHIVKTIHALTKGSNIEDAAEREAKSAKKEKKAAKKQKEIAERLKEVDEMKAKIDQIAHVVAELNGDLPKALASGYRATQGDANLFDPAVLNALKEGQKPDPLGDFMGNMFNFKGNG